MRGFEETVQISATFGEMPGYENLGGDRRDGSTKEIGATIQRVAQEEFERTGIYCSFVINPSYTVYHSEWGCPDGGEPTVTVSTVCNQRFLPEGTGLEDFTDTAVAVLEKVKKDLKQSAVIVEAKNIGMLYLCEKK